MKIKIEIVDDELKSISTDYVSYIDLKSYEHAKEFHTESVLEEMADEILIDLKLELSKLKTKKI
jgi:hypothetical protein